MTIQLSEHFTYKKLLRFTFPTIVMMIFTSIYSVVDGIFVSNFVGKTAFAAVNLIMPFLIFTGTIGFMLGTGGSALVAKTLGEGDKNRANKYFSMTVYAGIAGGVILAVLGIVFARPVAFLLGADNEMLDYCTLYARIILVALPAFVLQNIFQSFLVTAEKPKLGLFLTVLAGVTNMVLDLLFVGIFKWGITGAAVATGISQTVGGVIPLVYFLRPNSSALSLVRTKINSRTLLRVCVNGSSEMLSNISLSVVNMLYNYQLMRLAGENGVAAYGAIMYINFIFVGVYFGYAVGAAPIIGYHYGAQNHDEMKSLFKKSVVLLTVWGVLMTVLAVLLAPPLSGIFVGYDAELFALTNRGFKIYALSFLLMGYNIFASAFFTALNNGAVSAAISFLRTLVFQIVPVMTLPLLFGSDGIWFSVVAAEIMSIVVSVFFVARNRKKYHYI